MRERDIDRRRRDAGRTPAPSAAPELSTDPVLRLQRSIGNAAVTQLLARKAAAKGATGSVQIAGVGAIKVSGGNLEEWAGKGTPDTVELASETGKHSAKLEKLSAERTKTDVKLTISPPHAEGEDLNVGGGTVLDIKDARVRNYAVEDGAETWRLADFTAVKRTKITHRIGSE